MSLKLQHYQQPMGRSAPSQSLPPAHPSPALLTQRRRSAHQLHQPQPRQAPEPKFEEQHYANISQIRQNFQYDTPRPQHFTRNSLDLTSSPVPPSYATLPSRRSAFKAPVKPPRKCNELEEYARQYEDLYSRRLWSSRGSTTSAGSTCSQRCSTPWRNENMDLPKSPSSLVSQSPNPSKELSVPIYQRNPMKKHSLGQFPSETDVRSATLPRPPRSTPPRSKSREDFSENSSDVDSIAKNFDTSKRFFAELEAKASNSNGVQYSTMSLPRKLPVKKLVSVFNNQIEKESNRQTPKPIYSTLQRRLRSNRCYQSSNLLSVDRNEAEPLRRKSFGGAWQEAGGGGGAERSRRASMVEKGASVVPWHMEERQSSVDRMIEEWKRELAEVQIDFFKNLLYL